MNFNTSYNKIITDENLMETLQHGTTAYPFKFYYDNLRLYDFNCIEWHWHTEFEFVYNESGTVSASVGENQISLSEGDGIFINTKVLHRFYSTDNAVIPNFLCLPEFIACQNSLIYDKYVLPMMTSKLNFQVFTDKTAWQAEILFIMKEIITLQKNNSECELITAALVQKLWSILYENSDVQYDNEHNKFSTSSQARLQMMMQYIHQNFANDVSLGQIAEFAMVSKSTALNFFHRFLHITPIQYLINYRLKEAARLLLITENNIKTISEETGFESVDYFCRRFKAHYNLTPTQYRKEKSLTEPAKGSFFKDTSDKN